MKKHLWFTTLAAMVAVAIGSTDLAFGGRGGGGGGGRAGGGGGGGARPSVGGGGGGGARPSVGSAPSVSRPSAPAARPSAPAAKPAAPQARPSTPSARPGQGNEKPGVGNLPSAKPETRPGNGIGGTNPGARPGTGTGNLPGTRPSQPGTALGIANRPGTGALPNNKLPGAANRPGTLPGLGAGGAGSKIADRPQSLEGRRDGLNDRMANSRDHWHDGHNNNWHDHHEDWHNWADHNQHWHGGWYHGCWHGGWYGGSYWNHMWEHHPAAAAFGLTAWGVNRLAYGWGYWGYSNPYYGSGSSGYNYSQPLVTYQDNSTTVNAAAEPDPADPAMVALDEARGAFYGGDYAMALAKLDTTLKTMPGDTAVHEFRSLVLFAQKKYPESAAAIYAVLSAGPGWDWTTMSGLYPSVDVYTQQLRALEVFAKANPKSADAHFLLGYHYLTATHAEAASKQFKLAQAELPDDRLVAQLSGMTTPPDPAQQPVTPAEPPAVAPEKVLKSEQFVGSWKATSQGATFQLDLTKEGTFTWTYSRGKEKQSVKGVFAVDQNVLALEVDDGSAMLAEIDFSNPSQFLFKMIGGDEKDSGLQFKKE